MAEKTFKILVVDDEPDILEFLSYNLEKEGFSVETAENGKQALEKAKKSQPDIVLLDVMMPEMDGIEACRTMREMPQFEHTIIAFLTARTEDYSQIAGFETGADDYISKPIKPRVLVSRLKALLRRYEAKESKSSFLDVGNIQIDRERYLIIFNGTEMAVPRKEFELLYLLASKPGKVFKRDEILNEIWGRDIIVGDRTIDVHIRKLREKLGEDLIKTVKGIGYKFEEI
ncbi:MAG TPA: response regulator transcription factor [Chitinophagales bacterium]|jgi:two-component system alkaline phosphatase synthesis response regulator PhoP|nr:response regulator transcription factor [Chitinophagales bacterium]MBP6154546.1 response regulator transcription factor [Chitinophagales bacterium]HQV77759.1 response regulator transcription factor [Chitinophagales bacterium]HQW78233.1 response regulator transcription factor [Chitinophagales bacterium]HRB18888.1 response regulator transcription factor [Chitinophagales bacterium]